MKAVLVTVMVTVAVRLAAMTVEPTYLPTCLLTCLKKKDGFDFRAKKKKMMVSLSLAYNEMIYIRVTKQGGWLAGWMDGWMRVVERGVNRKSCAKRNENSLALIIRLSMSNYVSNDLDITNEGDIAFTDSMMNELTSFEIKQVLYRVCTCACVCVCVCVYNNSLYRYIYMRL